MLGDDFAPIIAQIETQLRQGVDPKDLCRAMTYAGAVRTVRFHLKNDEIIGLFLQSLLGAAQRGAPALLRSCGVPALFRSRRAFAPRPPTTTGRQHRAQPTSATVN